MRIHPAWIGAGADQVQLTLRIIAFVLLIVWMGSMMGCAAFDAVQYWYRRPVPRTYAATIYGKLPVGLWGYSYDDGIVIVSTDAPPMLWDCIEQHEKTELTHYHYPQQIGGVWCNLTTFMPVPQAMWVQW